MAKRKRPSQTPDPSPDFFQEKEQMLNAVQKALQDMPFESAAEANAFLAQFAGMKMADVMRALGGTNDASRQATADEMFFAAMEARTRLTVRRKLAAVLKFDPDHVRALAVLAIMESKPESIEKGLRHAIAAGERKLGPMLQEESGQLWGWFEARPYLEARAELAQFLAEEDGRQDEAIAEHQELLRLNENDNQGIRDPLLGLLLEMHRFDEARALIKKYDTDYAATWMYAKALLRFQECAAKAGWDTSRHDLAWLDRQMTDMAEGKAPDIPKAVRAADKTLAKALKFNPWCAIYLIKAEEYLEHDLPPYYSPGSEEEARLFLEYHNNAWVANPSALLWLTLTALPWLMQNGFQDELMP